ncbi:ferritin family protein [Candidatus Woesearchaeota archaeon]|nr:ferritin family protein [Candidatus Woesearchaeota archaeon]
MAEDILKWIRFGIETEEKGIEFYTKCLKEIKHPRAMELFDWLVRVEEGHKRILQRLLKAEAKADDKRLQESIDQFLAERVENPMFPQEALKRIIRPEATIIQMFNIAMELEAQGIELYGRLAKKQKDHKIKALFERLAADEEDHRKEIRQLGEFVFGIGAVESLDEE